MLCRMSPRQRPASPQAELVYRQRSSQLLGWAYVVVAALLMVDLALTWRTAANWAFLVWLLLGLAVVWALFLRPHVRVAREGVTLSNIVRDVFIPWALLEDVGTRWNLEVYTPERNYTSWAISAQINRPKSGLTGGLMGMAGGRAGRGLSSGALDGGASATGGSASGRSASGAPAVTSRAVAEVIEETRNDYVAAVASGALAPEAGPAVQRRWRLEVVCALLVPLAAAILLALG